VRADPPDNDLDREYDEWLRRQEVRERRHDVSAGEDFAQGVNLGLAKTGTSAARGVSWLARLAAPLYPAVADLGRRGASWADEAEREAEEYYDPRGTAGTAGEITGRLTGEVATSMGGGRLAARAITELAPASRAAQALFAARKGTVGQRVAAETLPFLPVDAVMGAGGSDEGFVLPGRGGAAVENVAMGALPTAGIEAILARRDIARAAAAAARGAPATPPRPMAALPSGSYEMPANAREPLQLPPGAIAAPRAMPETRADRLLPEHGELGRPVSEPIVDPMIEGPGIPQPSSWDAVRARRLPVPVTPEFSTIVPRQQHVDEAAPGTAWMDQLADRARGLEETAIERVAIAGESAPNPWSVELDALAARVPRTVPNDLARLTDDELLDLAVYRERRAHTDFESSAEIDALEAMGEATNTGRAMGHAGAKRLFGSAEDARRFRGVSEEMAGALSERGMTPRDLRAAFRASARLEGGDPVRARLAAELERRGLSIGGDTSTDFDFELPAGGASGTAGAVDAGTPMRLASRPGAIARELLEAMGTGAAGAAVGAATGGPPPNNRTRLNAADESRFQEWYRAWAERAGLDPDPDSPLHMYDYRGAFRAGIEPEVDAGDGFYHWPSEFKDDNHPNRFVEGVGDTKHLDRGPSRAARAAAGFAIGAGARSVAPRMLRAMTEIPARTEPLSAREIALREHQARMRETLERANGVIERLSTPRPPGGRTARAGNAQAAIVNTAGGGAIGAVGGAMVGEDPETRRRNAAIGAVGGAGLGGAVSPILRAASRVPKTSALFASDANVRTIAESIRRGERADPATKPGLLGWARRAYQSFVNESYAAERLGRLAGTGDNVKQAVAQSHGWEGAAEQFLADEFKPIVEAARGQEEDVMALLKAQRAIDQLTRGVADKTGIPIETHIAARDALEATPGVKRVAEQLRAFYRRLLEMKRDAGVISADQYDQIVASEDFYTPFIREWDDRPTVIGAKKGGKNLQSGTGVRKLNTEQQARADTVDPFEIAVQDAGEAFRSIAKQRVTDVVLAAYHADPDLVSAFIRPMAATENVTPGMRLIEANVGGRRTRWQVMDRDLYDAFGAYDEVQHGLLVKLLAHPKRWLQFGVTMMPDFAVANALRDTAGAAVQQRGLGRSVAAGAVTGGAANAALGDDEESLALRVLTGMGFGAGAGALGPQALKNLRALADIAREAPEYKQFLREGGYTMGNYPKNSRDARDVLERLRRSGVSPADVVSPSRWVDLVNWIGRSAEQATRLAKWKEIKAAGGGLGERVLGAQDVSLRFSQVGRDTKGIAAMTAFWNAKVQGWDKLVRMLKQPKTWGVGAAAITAPSLALWEVNRDNPEYWARPQWERNMFWLVPKGGDAGGFWRVPKPFEIGFLFGSLPERFMDHLATTGAIASASPIVGAPRAREIAWSGVADMLRTTMDGSLPIPTGALAGAEQAFNFDTFRNRRIVTRPDLPAEFQTDDRTSSVALAAGKAGVSPQRVDKLVRDLSGATGDAALQLTDGIARRTGLDERPLPERKPIVVGRFSTTPGSISDPEAQLRERFDALERAYRGAKYLERENRSAEEIGAYIDAHEDELVEHAVVSRVMDAINDLRTKRRELMANRALPATDRRALAAELDAAIADLAAAAVRGDLVPPTGAKPQ
jgi:hypothetical protein